MAQPLPSASDPTPEERGSDSSFLPVVIAFVIAIFVVLIAGIIFIKVRQQKALPNPKQPHPTSLNAQPAIQPRPSAPLAVFIPEDHTKLKAIAGLPQ